MANPVLNLDISKAPVLTLTVTSDNRAFTSHPVLEFLGTSFETELSGIIPFASLTDTNPNITWSKTSDDGKVAVFRGVVRMA
jgi:hypothetical protein